MKNHSCNLYAPLCSIFYLYSVVAARIFVKKNAPSHFWKCAFCLIMFPAIIPSNSLYCHATCFFSCLLRIEKQISKQPPDTWKPTETAPQHTTHSGKKSILPTGKANDTISALSPECSPSPQSARNRNKPLFPLLHS